MSLKTFGKTGYGQTTTQQQQQQIIPAPHITIDTAMEQNKTFTLLKEQEKRWDKQLIKNEFTWEETSTVETTTTWNSLFTVPKFPTLESTIMAPIQRRLSSLGSEVSTKLKPKRKTLLAPQRPADSGKLTVLLDLDETLIHSEFTGTNDYRQAELREHVSGRRPPDFSIVLYEGSTEQEEEIVHVYKRPGVENFLRKLSEICEPVIFTAALPMYARPILKQIDPKRRCRSRLYRNATVKYRGIPHVKALKSLGRDMARVVLIDNSPVAMSADPENALLCKAFYEDPEDRELDRLYEIVKELLHQNDVRQYLITNFNFHQTLNDALASIMGM